MALTNAQLQRLAILRRLIQPQQTGFRALPSYLASAGMAQLPRNATPYPSMTTGQAPPVSQPVQPPAQTAPPSSVSMLPSYGATSPAGARLPTMAQAAADLSYIGPIRGGGTVYPDVASGMAVAQQQINEANRLRQQQQQWLNSPLIQKVRQGGWGAAQPQAPSGISLGPTSWYSPLYFGGI